MGLILGAQKRGRLNPALVDRGSQTKSALKKGGGTDGRKRPPRTLVKLEIIRGYGERTENFFFGLFDRTCPSHLNLLKARQGGEREKKADAEGGDYRGVAVRGRPQSKNGKGQECFHGPRKKRT